jgi:hypothetical protein
MDENSNEPPSFQVGDVVLTAYGVGGDCQWKENDFYACACGVSLEDPWDLGTALLQPSASHSIPYRTVNILASLLKLVVDRHKFYTNIMEKVL